MVKALDCQGHSQKCVNGVSPSGRANGVKVKRVVQRILRRRTTCSEGGRCFKITKGSHSTAFTMTASTGIGDGELGNDTLQRRESGAVRRPSSRRSAYIA